MLRDIQCHMKVTAAYLPLWVLPSLIYILLKTSLVSAQTKSAPESKGSGTGELTIKTNLRYSIIYIENELVGSGSIRNMKLVRDIYPVRVETPYFETVYDTVNLLEQAKVSRIFQLVPLMGMVELRTNTPQTDLEIKPVVDSHRFFANDTLMIGYATPMIDHLSMNLQAGPYQLSLASPGYYPLNAQFEVSQGDVSRLRVDLLDGRADYEQQRSTLIRKSVLFVFLAAAQQVMKDQAGEHYFRYINALTVTDAETNRSKTQFYDGASIVTLTLAVGVGAWAIHDYNGLKHLGEKIQIKKVSP